MSGTKEIKKLCRVSFPYDSPFFGFLIDIGIQAEVTRAFMGF